MAADMQPGTGVSGEQGPPLAAGRSRAAAGGRRPGLLTRLMRFVPDRLRRARTYYREVVSELRKVIYPTRTELGTYVVVVLVFVSFMVAATFGLDTLFGKLDLLLFGK